MPRTVLRHSIETLVYISLTAILGVSLPFALVLNGVVSLSVGLLWSLVSIIVWVYLWGRWEKSLRLRNLPLGTRETWFFTVTVFFGIIGVGISLISLSAFGAHVSSHCGLPTNVNVTSLNCKTVVIDPPASGFYSDWGPRGAFLVILGAVGLPSFIALASINYLLYGKKSAKSETYNNRYIAE